MCAQHRTHPRQLRRWTSRIVLAVFLALIATCAALVVSGRYQIRPVLSGSMRPGLPVGGIVITERVPATSLQVRDVIVFHRPDHPQDLVVHRIVSMTSSPAGLVVHTQGDANDTADSWTLTLHGTTAYRATFSLPLAGYVAIWAHSRTGRATFLLGGLALLLGTAESTLVTARRPQQETPADASVPARPEVSAQP
jgi:signal peptidase I